MKHKSLWIFVLMCLIFCLFQTPLLSVPMEKLADMPTVMLVFITDFYAFFMLLALAIAKAIVYKIDSFFASKNEQNEIKLENKDEQ